MQSFIWSPSKQTLDLRWRWVLHCELPLTVPKHHEGHAPKSRLFSNIPAREGGAEDEFLLLPSRDVAPRVYFSLSLFFNEIVRRLVWSLFAFHARVVNVATKLNSASPTFAFPHPHQHFFSVDSFISFCAGLSINYALYSITGLRDSKFG